MVTCISQFGDYSGTCRTGSNLVDLAKRAHAGLDAVLALKTGFKIS